MNFNLVETDLAKELQKRKFGSKANHVENRRICAESEEIKQLLSKIKNAYMNKERAAQQHEKQVRKIQLIHEEAEMDTMMLNARKHEKDIQMQRKIDEKIAHDSNKDVLFDQMFQKRVQVEEAKQQYLLEKDQVNNIVQKIRDDDHQKYLLGEKKKKQCFQDMLESLADKKQKIQSEEDRIAEENRLYLIHLAKKQKRQENFAQLKAEVEAAKDKIFSKLKTEQEQRDREAEEWWQLQELLNRELLDKKFREQEQREREKLAQQKQSMHEAEIQAKAMRAEQMKEIVRQKEVFQKQYQEAWENDMREEQLNKEKRKKKLLEHRTEIERQWQCKLDQFKDEKNKEIMDFQRNQAIEQYKAQIVEEEKARLLREHLPYIENFLPKGILEKPDPNKMADKQIGQSYR